jgi:diketogulonate reductase-like aldo/keto reductase
MEKVHEIGLVKHLGVSNFSPSLLHMLLGCLDQVHPIINQVEVHPYNPQQALFRFCQNNNITMQAYSPLAGGGSIGEYNLFQERSIVEASENHRVSPAEILFAWSLQRGIPFVSSTKRIERIKPMLASKNIPLTKDEMKRINDISFRHRFGVPDQFKFLFL